MISIFVFIGAVWRYYFSNDLVTFGAALHSKTIFLDRASHYWTANAVGIEMGGNKLEYDVCYADDNRFQ